MLGHTDLQFQQSGARPWAACERGTIPYHTDIKKLTLTNQPFQTPAIPLPITNHTEGQQHGPAS